MPPLPANVDTNAGDTDTVVDSPNETTVAVLASNVDTFVTEAATAGVDAVAGDAANANATTLTPATTPHRPPVRVALE